MTAEGLWDDEELETTEEVETKKDIVPEVDMTFSQDITNDEQDYQKSQKLKNLHEALDEFNLNVSSKNDDMVKVDISCEPFDDFVPEAPPETESRGTDKAPSGTEIASMIQESTEKAMKYQQDKMKLEINDTLDEEIGYHLKKYNKRRARRDLKDGIATAIKVIIVLAIIGVLFGNPTVRNKIFTVASDFKDLVVSLMNGEDASSNELIDNLFEDSTDTITVNTEEPVETKEPAETEKKTKNKKNKEAKEANARQKSESANSD